MDLKEFRKRFPVYDELPDQELADRLYQRHYSDVPRPEFDTQIGLVGVSSRAAESGLLPDRSLPTLLRDAPPAQAAQSQPPFVRPTESSPSRLPVDIPTRTASRLSQLIDRDAVSSKIPVDNSVGSMAAAPGMGPAGQAMSLIKGLFSLGDAGDRVARVVERTPGNVKTAIGAKTTGMVASGIQALNDARAANLDEELKAGVTPVRAKQIIKGIVASRETSKKAAGVASAARTGMQEAIPKDAGLVERAFINGLSDAAVALPAIVAGGPIMGSALLGSGAGAARYSELIAQGVNEADAARSGLLLGSLEGATEFLPGAALVKKVPGFWKHLTEFMVREVPGENINTIAEMVDDYGQGLRDDITKDDLIQAVKETTAATAVGAGAQVGAAHLLQKVGERSNELAEFRALEQMSAQPKPKRAPIERPKGAPPQMLPDDMHPPGLKQDSSPVKTGVKTGELTEAEDRALLEAVRSNTATPLQAAQAASLGYASLNEANQPVLLPVGRRRLIELSNKKQGQGDEADRVSDVLPELSADVRKQELPGVQAVQATASETLPPDVGQGPRQAVENRAEVPATLESAGPAETESEKSERLFGRLEQDVRETIDLLSEAEGKPADRMKVRRDLAQIRPLLAEITEARARGGTPAQVREFYKRMADVTEFDMAPLELTGDEPSRTSQVTGKRKPGTFQTPALRSDASQAKVPRNVIMGDAKETGDVTKTSPILVHGGSSSDIEFSDIPADSEVALDSSGFEGSPNAAIRSPKSIGNTADIEAAIMKGYGSLDTPRRLRVLQSVLSSIENPKIFKDIVSSIPVDVMNDLAGEKFSTKKILHDSSVFKDALTVARGLPIETRTVDAFIRSPAFHAAGIPLDTRKENLSTVLTDQSDRHVGAIFGKEVEIAKDPTQAEIKAGNYKKASIKFHTIPIKIENLKGSFREGKSANGRAWRNRLFAHYGYISKTSGADSEQIDVFLGDNPKSEQAFVIDQLRSDGKTWDEHKVILAVDSADEAEALYRKHYPSSWKGLGAITPMTMPQFKEWLKSGDTKTPVAWRRPVQRSTRKPQAEHDSILEYISKLRLTGNKSAGINFDAAVSEGLDPEDLKKAAGHGIGRPFTKGGASLDQIAEALFEAGYPVTNEKGEYDKNVLLNRLTDELRGQRHSSVASQDYEKRFREFSEKYEAQLDEEFKRRGNETLDEAIDRANAALEAAIAERDAMDAAVFEREREPGEDDEVLFHRKDQGDLFSSTDAEAKVIATRNALKKLEAERDRKRNTGQESVETGRRDDLFSQAVKQRDLIKEKDAQYSLTLSVPKHQMQLPLVRRAVHKLKQQAGGNKMILKPVGELKFQGKKKSGPEGVAALVSDLVLEPQEILVIVGTNDKDEPIVALQHSIGGVNSASVSPGIALGAVLSMPEVKGIYMVHNHPSGITAQSDADKNISGKISDLLDGTGVKYNGSMVVGREKGKFSMVPGDDLQQNRYEVSEPEGSVPLVRRNFSGESTLDDRAQSVRNPHDAKQMVQKMGTGVYFLDTHYSLMEFVPLTENEMSAMRSPVSAEESNSARLLRAIHESNAVNAIIGLKEEPSGGRAIENMLAFLQRTHVSPLDIVEAGQSWAASGEMDNVKSFSGLRTLFHKKKNRVEIPDAVIAHSLVQLSFGTDLVLAKSGDEKAALRIAREYVTNQVAKSVETSLVGQKPIVVPVISLESAGENQLPGAVAKVLAKKLGLADTTDIIQSTSPHRTGLSGLDRVFARPEFTGEVKKGATYLLVDDVLTQGGTFAALERHIVKNGGRVVGAFALTGKQYSRTLRLSDQALKDLRAKYAYFEPQFVQATGYGFDGLTESEARYLLKHSPSEQVADRIVEAARQANGGVLRSRTGEVEDDPLFHKNPAVQPVFYSSLLRSIEASKQAKATPDQWLGILANMPGIKKEEREWIGIDDWLKEQTGFITREQLADFVHANQITVKEVVYGGAEESSEYHAAAARAAELYEKAEALRRDLLKNEKLNGVVFDPGSFQPDAAWLGVRISMGQEEAIALAKAKDLSDSDIAQLREYGDVKRSASEAAGERDAIQDNSEAIRYEKYKLPGGENYHELLLTLPINDKTLLPENMDRLAKQMFGKPYNDLNISQQNEIHRAALHKSQPYESSHWSEPNILAHIRFDERIDASGKRTMHIAEIQSDWHQSGRKEGYKEPLNDLEKELQSLNAKTWDTTITNEDFARLQQLKAEGVDVSLQRKVSGVPNAPFKTSWPELAAKRAIRWAAENGMDRITWDTGATQADRFNLSHHIEALRANLNPDGTYQLGIQKPGENMRKYQTSVPASELQNHIGKELADKIITEVTQPGVDNGKIYSGLDMDVGGSGQAGFYDKILPDTVNKLVKKWGAKVSTTRFPGALLDKQKVGEGDFPYSIVGNFTGNEVNRFRSMEAAQEELRELEKVGNSRVYTIKIDQALIDKHSAVAHAVDVTPQMREAALAGLPLFRRAAAQGSSSRAFHGQVRARAEAIISKFKVRAGMSVVPTFDELPPEVRARARMNGATGTEDALYDPPTGSTYLISGNIDALDDVERLVLHEQVVHFGLRDMLATEERNRIMDGIARDMEWKVREKARDYGLRLSNVQERRIAAEEVVAEAAETYLRGGKLAPAMRRWLDRLIKALRDALARLGLVQKRFDDKFVASLLVSLHEHVRTGQAKYAEALVADLNEMAFRKAVSEFPDVVAQENTDPAREDGFLEKALAWTTTRDLSTSQGRLLPNVVQSSARTERSLAHKKAPARVSIIDVEPKFGGAFMKARRWAYQNVRGEYENRASGMKISVSGHALSKALSESAVRKSSNRMVHIDAVQSLPALIENAVIAESRQDLRQDSGTTIHRLYAALREEGRLYRVKLTVKEGNPPGGRYYTHELQELEIEPASYTTEGTERMPVGSQPDVRSAGSTPGGARPPSSGDEISIRQLLAGVQRDDGTDLDNSLFHKKALLGVYRRRNAVQQGTFDLEEGSRTSRVWNMLVFKFQDKLYDLLRLQDQAKIFRQAAHIPESMDAYLKETLYHGRVEERITEYEKQFVEPLVELIKNSGYSWADVEEYLYARHAPEANARYAAINPGQPNINSGMTDQEATQIMQDLGNRGQISNLQAIGSHIDQMTKWHRDLLVQEGLEDQSVIQEWESTYQHYVPLKGWAHNPELAEMPKRGKGFDTGGKSTKERTGRTSRAGNILANIVAEAQMGMIRAEKARVGRALLEFVKANPAPRLYEVNTVEYMRYLDKGTGLVRQGVNPTYKLADNVLRVRVNGKDEHIIFNPTDPQMIRMASAMKNLSAVEMNSLLTFMHGINRWLSMANTSLNLEFVISNAFRDVQTAMVNIEATDARKLRGKILKAAPAAWRGIRLGEKGKPHPWATVWDRFKKVGGKVGWIQHYSSPVSIEDKLKEQLDRSGAIKVAGDGIAAVLEWIERQNLAVENAIRLATFKVAVDAGINEERAASIAKNLTVNFNKRGDAGPLMNSLYLFFNASIQGTAILVRTAKNPRARRIMYGIVTLGILGSLLARMMGGEDEDKENRYDKIEDNKKERNVIIMLPPEQRFKLPSGDEIDHVTLPMPYGYNFMYYLGTKIGDYIDYYTFGNKQELNPGEDAMRLVSTFLGAYNPIGNALTFEQYLAPTVLDPFVQLSQNKAWDGRPIMPPAPQYDIPPPDSQRFYKTASAASRLVTETLNKATGGTAVTPGVIDISPETLDHLVGTALGGAGRFASNMVNTPYDLVVRPKDLELYEIPMVRRLIGQTGDRQRSETFYQRFEETAYARAEFDQLREMRRDHAAQDEVKTREKYIERKYPIAAKMVIEAKRTQAQLQALRRQRRLYEEREGKMLESARQERIQDINERIGEIMDRFNEHWNAIRDAKSSPTNTRDLIGRIAPIVDGKTRREAVQALRSSGLPATADLLASLPVNPKASMMEVFRSEAASAS